jgi:hypothetical protein
MPMQREWVKIILPKLLRARLALNFWSFRFGRIGWGGRIRTFTIHINSVVSYRLDHAPAALGDRGDRPNR